MVRTTQTFLIVFLYLAIVDVAHHSSYRPEVVFACGWVAYSLPFTAGKVLGELMVAQGSNSVLAMSVVVWLLVMVTLFVLDDSSIGDHLVFAGLAQGVEGDEDIPAMRVAAIQSELDAVQSAAATSSPAEAPDPFASRCESVAQGFALTPREAEILALLVRGRSKAHIAEAFIISENTVRGHVKHIYAKLDVHNKQELLDLFEGSGQ